MNITANGRSLIEDAMNAGTKPFSIRYGLSCFVLSFVLAYSTSAQDSSKPSTPSAQQHTHSGAQSIEVEFPRFGRAQANAKDSLFTLDRALETARENNPTFRQAEAGVKAARARAL